MEPAMRRPARHRFPPARRAARAAMAVACLCGPVQADPGDLGIGIGASTLGATVEATYRISDRFGLRVPASYLDGSYSDTDDGIAYDLDLTMGGVGLLGDYYPGGGGFRLSGGAFVATLDGDGRARGNGTVGETAYTGVDLEVDASARNGVMPALAVGYDAGLGARWLVSADLGALYTGGFDVGIRDRSGQVSQADLDAEIRKQQDDAPDFYPYVKLTVAFRF
jgi:hypothetical protein